MQLAGIEQDFKAIWDSRAGGEQRGHAHFWERALSRRQLLGRTAVLAGAAAGSTLGFTKTARAAPPGPGVPGPVPGGTTIDGLGLFHFYFPTTSNPVGSTTVVANGRGDPATITDFNGFIGLGDWTAGTGTDGGGTTLFWAADLRFMDGEYIGLDGRHRQGAFAFV
jgi:hypothetical protein